MGVPEYVTSTATAPSTGTGAGNVIWSASPGRAKASGPPPARETAFTVMLLRRSRVSTDMGDPTTLPSTRTTPAMALLVKSIVSERW
jgi:hypothetical protein